jgi:hypothetical protein
LLSAILKLLPTLVKEDPKKREIHHMMPLLVAAYPDLRPWQVRKAATVTNADGEKISKSTTIKDNNDFYYNYLSLLLHPEEGSDTARRDGSLVEVGIFLLSHFFLMFRCNSFSSSNTAAFFYLVYHDRSGADYLCLHGLRKNKSYLAQRKI